MGPAAVLVLAVSGGCATSVAPDPPRIPPASARAEVSPAPPPPLLMPAATSTHQIPVGSASAALPAAPTPASPLATGAAPPDPADVEDAHAGETGWGDDPAPAAVGFPRLPAVSDDGKTVALLATRNLAEGMADEAITRLELYDTASNARTAAVVIHDPYDPTTDTAAGRTRALALLAGRDWIRLRPLHTDNRHGPDGDTIHAFAGFGLKVGLEGLELVVTEPGKRILLRRPLPHALRNADLLHDPSRCYSQRQPWLAGAWANRALGALAVAVRFQGGTDTCPDAPATYHAVRLAPEAASPSSVTSLPALDPWVTFRHPTLPFEAQYFKTPRLGERGGPSSVAIADDYRRIFSAAWIAQHDPTVYDCATTVETHIRGKERRLGCRRPTGRAVVADGWPAFEATLECADGAKMLKRVSCDARPTERQVILFDVEAIYLPGYWNADEARRFLDGAKVVRR
jgi:hypothetical protein